MTLPGLLQGHAAERPEAIALEFESRRTGYGEFDQRTTRIAAWLAGTSPAGARIAYLGKNSDRYFELLFAAAKAGLVTVPLNWRLKSDEWLFILRDATAACLFVDDEFTAEGRELALQLGLPAPLCLEDPADWGAMAASPSGAGRLPEVRTADTVLQIYTSGTTGTPKGVMLSHGNVLALREPGLSAGLPWFPRTGDTSLVAMPVAHIAGTAYGLFGLHSGGRLAILRTFDAGRVLALLAESRASHMLLAPAALRLLLDHPAAAATDLSSLRYLTYGGSPISQALLEKAMALLRCDFIQMYGMTEASGGVAALTPEDHRTGGAERLQSAGRAMLGVALGIVDAAGHCLPPGEVGEIVVRSAAVMQGYWRRPEATAKAIDAEGWLRTGDIGVLDAGGYLTVRDRANDTIVTGGENVYPAEVENLLAAHPDIADIAIIGIPSERWGEEVKAIVVPKPGRTPRAEEIIAWARQRIALFKVPKSIDFADELPRNAGGKVLRRLLREPYWMNHDRRVG